MSGIPNSKVDLRGGAVLVLRMMTQFSARPMRLLKLFCGENLGDPELLTARPPPYLLRRP